MILKFIKRSFLVLLVLVPGILLAQPANDLCTGAVPLTLGGPCVNGTNVGAADNVNNPSCHGGAPNSHEDVWYSFVATGTQFNATLTTGTMAGDIEYVLISGTCTSLFEEDCVTGASPLSVQTNGLTIGTTYYVLISNGGSNATGTFSICDYNTTTPALGCAQTSDNCNAPVFMAAGNDVPVCVNSCNTGNAPGPDFLGNNCYDFPDATAWFSVTAPAGSAQLDIDITSGFITNPYFTVFTSTNCTNFTIIDCYDTGAAGAVSGTVNVTPGTTYLIAVSDLNGAEGEFQICANFLPDASLCNVDDEMNETASSDPSTPIGGPYSPGEVVTFCYTINQYMKEQCNWLQGIIPTFGDCWDPASFLASGAPAVVTDPLDQAGNNAGVWSWWPNGTVQYNTGHPLAGQNSGAGWYFVLTAQGSDPDLTFGDGGANGPAACDPDGNGFTWTVCFQLIAGPVSNCTNGTTDCGISVNTVGDGEVGAWGNNGCNADTDFEYNAGFQCCVAPVITAVSDQTFCSGGTASTTLTSDQDPGVTYSWTVVAGSNISGASAGTGASISQVLTNSGTTAQTVVYTITADNGSCTSISTFTVTVNPIPTVNDPADIVVCPGAAINPVDFVSTPAGATFNWTNSNTAIGLAASGSGQITTYTAPANATGAVISGNITVTPTLNGCVGPSQVFTISINPTPTVNDPADVLVCPGATIDPQDFVSVPAGATFNWTNSNTANGLAASGSGQITPYTAPANTTGTVVTGNVTVTPVLNGCSGPSQVFAIAINPTPTVNDPADVIVCPGATIDPQDFVSVPAGATFNWINSNTAIGLAASGSGQITPYTAPANLTGAAISGNITVTPILNGCSGPSQVFVITVNPTPTVNDPADVVVCSGATIDPQDFVSVPPGATFNWTNSNTAIGLSASGSGQITPYTAPANATGAIISGNITVTPSINGCVGPAQVFAISINPTPTVNAPADITVCPGSTIDPQDFVSVPAGATFNWTNSNTANGLAASGSGQITPYNAPANATGSVVSGNVTVTPVLNGCSGPSQVFVIAVSPTPTVNNPGNQVLCANQPTSTVIFSGNNASTTYNWTNDNTSIGLAASGSGTINSFNALNAGASAQTATITVTPVLNGCVGTPEVFTITVNPIPVISTLGDDPNTCNGNDGFIDVTIPTNGTVSWTGTSSGSSASTAPLYSISNLTAGSYSVTFTSGAGCVSAVSSVTLNNPGAPIINPIPDYESCAIDFVVPNPLTAITGTNLTGNQAFYSAPGGNAANLIPQGTVFSAPTNTIIYAFDNNGACSAEIQFSVIVNTLPTATITPDPAVQCEGTSIVLNGNPLGGSGVYSHSWSGDVSILNATSVVNPNTITTATFGTYNLTYTVTDDQGCIGSDIISVTINQVPTLTLNNPPTVCAPAIANITLASVSSTNVGTLTYYTDPGFTTLVADPTAVGAGTYYVVAENAGCSVNGTVTVTEFALPVITLTGVDPSTCNGSNGTIDVNLITGPSSTGTLVWTGTSSGNDALANLSSSPNIVGLTAGAYDVTFTDNNGCISNTASVSLNNPGAPVINPISDYTSCAIDFVVPNPLTVITGTNLTGNQAFYSAPGGNPANLLNAGNIFSAPTNTVIYAYDANGTCSAEVQFNVIVNALPTASITPDPAAHCEGSSIVLNGNPAGGSGVYSHNWTGDVSILNATNTVDPATMTSATFGTYNLTYTVTDDQGCVGTDNISVTINQTPTLTLNDPAAVCSPNTVDITLTSVSNTNVGSLFYYSDAGLTTLVTDPTAVGAGTYYVEADNLGCTSSGSVTVTVNALPLITGVGSGPSVCNGNDGSIDVNLTSGPLTTGILNWTGTSSGSDPLADLTAVSNISGLTAGNYDVTFTDGNGCVSNLISIGLINPGAPILNNPGSPTVCDSYELPIITGTDLTGGQSYWTGSGGTGTQLSAGDLITTSQTVYIYDINGTCFDQELFNVTVNLTPSITTPIDQTACESYDLPAITGANISASAAYYNNSQANSGTVITSPITTTQTVWIYDSNGTCEDETSFVVTINPLPAVTSVNGGATYCAGEAIAPVEVSVTGSADWTVNYTLDGVAQTATGSTSPISLGNSAGVYIVTGIVDANCSNTASGTQSIVVNAIPSAPTAGTDSTYCSTWTLVPMTASGIGGTMTWYSDAALTDEISSGNSLVPSENLGMTTYYVTETLLGCEGPASEVIITINQCDITVPTAFTPDGDGVNENWQILDLDQAYPNNVVKIFNRWGNLLYEHDSSVDGPYDADRWDGTFNGESLPVGSYYFVIEFNDEAEGSMTGTVSILKKQ